MEINARHMTDFKELFILEKDISSREADRIIKNLYSILKDIGCNEITIKVINSIRSVSKKSAVLIGESFFREIEEVCDILKSKDVIYDYLLHWTKDLISSTVLKKMGCTAYEDLYENKIMIPKNGLENVFIYRGMRLGKISVRKNSIRLCEIGRISSYLKIFIAGNRAYIKIGKDCTIKDLNIFCGNAAKVVIGNDCMFARNIEIRQTDGHQIFDLNTRERINHEKDVFIGNHVWIGKDVFLLGGANIPDNCVLGARTVTSRKFEEKNCVIAGNPGKIIRQNILWARDDVSFPCQNYEECKDQEALKYLDKNYIKENF